MQIGHGAILAGTATVPRLSMAIEAYRDVLGLELVEQGTLDPALAQAWGCGGNAGAPLAILRPQSGEACWFRLVEQSAHPEFVPNVSFGWAAFECTVRAAASWPDRLPPELFEVRGLPKTPDNLEPDFIAMQALGPGQEMLYFNQVLKSPGDCELPKAASDFDKIFIAILAAPDREAAVAWYTASFGLQRAADHTLAYSMINRAFGQPPQTLTTITMVQNGLLPILEVDGYPAGAQPRPQLPELLPPGNAMISLAIDDLDRCNIDWLAPPAVYQSAPYLGRRAATVIGLAGELIECIELGVDAD